MKFVPWYYVTRALGAAAFCYAILVDATDDRTAIIVAAAGLMGLDKVARTEAPPKDKDKDDE